MKTGGLDFTWGSTIGEESHILRLKGILGYNCWKHVKCIRCKPYDILTNNLYVPWYSISRNIYVLEICSNQYILVHI